MSTTAPPYPDTAHRTPVSDGKLFPWWVSTSTAELRRCLLELAALDDYDRRSLEYVVEDLRAELVHRAHPTGEACHLRIGAAFDQALVRPADLDSTDLRAPLAALLGYLARGWQPGHSDDEDDTPPGAGYQEETGTPRSIPDTWGTRPGVPSSPRSPR